MGIERHQRPNTRFIKKTAMTFIMTGIFYKAVQAFFRRAQAPSSLRRVSSLPSR